MSGSLHPAGTKPPDSAPPVLTVTSASKAFGDRLALDGVSLTISAGEVYALIGPNGAGKTTLIRAICGRLPLDSGSVRVVSENPRSSATARRALGLVPQEIALYGDLTVRENLEILGRLAGVERSRLRAQVEEALEWTGLLPRARQRIEVLSGGMRRRVNLAAATLHRPRLVLLDEPTVGIDPTARERIHELLGALRSQGLAALLTTHDLDQAEQLADRVGLLHEGRLRTEGRLGELVAETFGEAQELAVKLAAAPDSRARRTLAGEGLQPTADPAAWSGSLSGGLTRLSELSQRLAAAAVTVEEFRVREPGLRGVYFSLTGEELGR